MSEFVGYINVQHVRQPAGTELCFASIISAMTGAEVESAQNILQDEGLLNEDGSVGTMMGLAEFRLGSSLVAIEPLELDSDDPSAVMELLDEQFAAGEAVALLHKKPWRIEELPANTDPTVESMKRIARHLGEGDAKTEILAKIEEKAPGEPLEDPVSYHWILLTGYPETDAGKGPIYAIDPLHEEAEYIGRNMIERVIRSSTDYNNGGQGVYPHSIRVTKVPVLEELRSS